MIAAVSAKSRTAVHRIGQFHARRRVLALRSDGRASLEADEPRTGCNVRQWGERGETGAAAVRSTMS